jgi:uncharacterized protein YbjT (DUF2867 family)
MKKYIEVRRRCEDAIGGSGICATILRPWYVLGPGHRWPAVLLPFYRIMECIPQTRPAALRLGLVTLEQIAAALDLSVANPPISGVRVVDVEGIRRLADLPAPGPSRMNEPIEAHHA